MEWKNFSVEWNRRFLSMEWKISKDMEYGKFLFHFIACPACLTELIQFLLLNQYDLSLNQYKFRQESPIF